MSNNSSSSLFHFTDSADKLIGILKNEFKPNFCLEKVVLADDTIIELAIPMICFCDIPLSQIKNHVKRYGGYGIGLSKEWAERKGLNPVLYLKKDSFLSANLRLMRQSKLLGLTEKFIKALQDAPEATGELFEKGFALSNVFRYAKNYEGELARENKPNEKVTFYNEREWRYIPKLELSELLQVPSNIKRIGLTKEQYENPVERANARLMIENERLSFEPGDIRYIIVKEEKEIIAMIDALRTIKAKYEPKVIEILTSRIITSEQILHDF